MRGCSNTTRRSKCSIRCQGGPGKCRCSCCQRWEAFSSRRAKPTRPSGRLPIWSRRIRTTWSRSSPTSSCLTRIKDFDGARQVANDALQRQPTSLPLQQARVRIDLLDKGIEAALQTADRLSSNPSNMPTAGVLKGGLLMGAQRYQGSCRRIPLPISERAVEHACGRARASARGVGRSSRRHVGAKPVAVGASGRSRPLRKPSRPST